MIKHAKGTRWAAIAVGCLAVPATGWFGLSSAAAADPSGISAAESGAQAAFYTYQAPGGASTRGQRVIALTFDDGPGPDTLPILSVLEQYHVPATFFEIGENVASHPGWTASVADAGYPVQDHTWNHADLTTIPASAYGLEVDRTQAEIASVTGKTPNCVRPPYDSFNAGVVQQLASRGLTTMSYSIDPKDWSDPGVSSIVQRVVGAALPGGVVDLHDGGAAAQTLAALPRIIDELRGMGYSFVSICGSSGPSRPYAYRSSVLGFGRVSTPVASLTDKSPPAGSAATSDGRGYWLVASDGGVFTYGDAHFYGSTGNLTLRQPIVGIAPTPDGRGYWLVASDGGVFTYGDAHFYGSTGNLTLNARIAALAPDPATGGYWLLAQDGGVFSFRAPFYGSGAGGPSDRTFFAIDSTRQGTGYLLGYTVPLS
jgi:peptidoglycan/xylan/chitin deacetylase (PgdA/CDA1 family)